MWRYIALLIMTPFIASIMYAQSIQSFNPYLTGSNQVLYVTTANEDTIQGTMVLFERKNAISPGARRILLLLWWGVQDWQKTRKLQYH